MATPLFQSSPLRPATAQFGAMDSSSQHFKHDLRLPHVHNDIPIDNTMDISRFDRARVVIYNLPAETTDQSMRFMFAWTRQPVTVTMLPPDPTSDSNLRTAILTLDSIELAHEVKKMYNGMLNPSQNGEMVVEVLADITPVDYVNGTTRTMSGASQPVFTRETTKKPPVMSSDGSITGLSVLSPSSNHRTSRFISNYHPHDNNHGGSIQKGEPRFTTSNDVPGIFSPQSPIGNHLSERSRITGKAMIKNESVDDDDTGELLLKQSLPFSADDVPLPLNNLQRRATAPQLPISRITSLSLNTGLAVSSSLPHPTHPSLSHHQSNVSNKHHQQLSQQPQTHSQTSQQKHHIALSSPHTTHPILSPTIHATGTLSSSGALSSFGLTAAPVFGRSNFPAANPADQNPPCNTLYVGNLPIDTSEEELKAMFSKQRGYKRLCFRTKSNGPMCFVEFEDVSFATKALNELYGQMLHNSVKGGIRLSFSKNPLGVRSGQSMNQLGPGSLNGTGNLLGPNAIGFNATGVPPPGLSVPPGLSGRGVGFGLAHNHSTINSATNHNNLHPSVHNPPSHYTPTPYSPPPTSHSWNAYTSNLNIDSPSHSHSSFTPPPSYNHNR